ncbi:hypothetical protein V6N13_115822 [Hibiscus sabdariffa]|uniref:Uncharacterized protein n=1 Tax=Hibiscus sabdariffa TaxID=183260 RepID=A0ABR2CSW1_9ROSI
MDVLGDALFSAGLEEWEHERKLVRCFLSHHKFHEAMPKIVWDRIQTGLILVLQRVSEHALVVDLSRFVPKTHSQHSLDYVHRL